MTYVPLLPKLLDFPEILALRAPAATMVLSCREDPLYTLSEMQQADGILSETFRRAGAADRYKAIFYDGGHKFDLAMQADAFESYKDLSSPLAVECMKHLAGPASKVRKQAEAWLELHG